MANTFQTLPGRLSAIPEFHPYIAPPPPVFPTAEVVADALNKILPAFDPVEKAKREVLMQSIQLNNLKLASEKANSPLLTKELEYKSKILSEQYDQLHYLGIKKKEWQQGNGPSRWFKNAAPVPNSANDKAPLPQQDTSLPPAALDTPEATTAPEVVPGQELSAPTSGLNIAPQNLPTNIPASAFDLDSLTKINMNLPTEEELA